MSNESLIRRHFPLLDRTINGYPLVYLDNAATSLKPQPVLDAIMKFYTTQGANIHRGIYTLAEETTFMYENARRVVAEFIGADYEEIIFTRGTTESINAVACTWAFDNLKPGEQVVVTGMEHHANFVPWQQWAARAGAHFTVLPVQHDGTLCLNNIETTLGNNTKIIAICQVSNVLGTHNDIALLTKIAHAKGARILIDAAQSVPHQKIDVHELDCDFLVFSGHKVMGPTGIGVLYAKKEILEAMRPYHYGGGMISQVSTTEASWLGLPQRFEAGTPPIASALGLAEALKYMKKYVDFDCLKKHEASMCKTLIEGLSRLKKAKIYGQLDQLQEKGHIVSFNIQGLHPHDIASYCDQVGICIRAGLHCAHPLAEQLGLGPSVRVSLLAYNTQQEIEHLLNTLECMVREMEKWIFV